MNREEMLDFIMPFGKHQGKLIKDVPIDYLCWMVTEVNTTGTLKTILVHFEDELFDEKASCEEHFGSYCEYPLLKEIV